MRHLVVARRIEILYALKLGVGACATRRTMGHQSGHTPAIERLEPVPPIASAACGESSNHGPEDFRMYGFQPRRLAGCGKSLRSLLPLSYLPPVRGRRLRKEAIFYAGCYTHRPSTPASGAVLSHPARVGKKDCYVRTVARVPGCVTPRHARCLSSRRLILKRRAELPSVGQARRVEFGRCWQKNRFENSIQPAIPRVSPPWSRGTVHWRYPGR